MQVLQTPSRNTLLSHYYCLILLMAFVSRPLTAFRSVSTRTLHGTWTMRSSSTLAAIPRAAVSVSVRTECNGAIYWLLVQRGKEPNRGLWSLPGGKLEFGESTLAGGTRELAEETTIDATKLQWYNGIVTTSDSIGESFHYVIAHCFAEYCCDGALPKLQATDDADNVDWYTLSQIHSLSVTPGLLEVFERVEALYCTGLLPVEAKLHDR